MKKWLAASLLATSLAATSQSIARAEAPTSGVAAEADGRHEGINWFSWADRQERPPLAFALLNFAALLFLLKKLAWPALRDGAAARHHEIARQLDEARRIRQEAEARLVEYQKRMAEIEQEIARVVASIREDAEVEKARMLQAAAEQAERIRKDAEFTVAQELKQARLDLEREIVVAAVAAAESSLRASAGEADDQRFAGELVSSLGASS